MSWLTPLILPTPVVIERGTGRRGRLPAKGVKKRRERALKLKRKGLSLTQIAQEMGLCRQTIHYYLTH